MIDTIRARHVPNREPDSLSDKPCVCLFCHQKWPCDTKRMLDALDDAGHGDGKT